MRFVDYIAELLRDGAERDARRAEDARRAFWALGLEDDDLEAEVEAELRRARGSELMGGPATEGLL